MSYLAMGDARTNPTCAVKLNLSAPMAVRRFPLLRGEAQPSRVGIGNGASYAPKTHTDPLLISTHPLGMGLEIAE
jgi:hypothetical protein